MPLIDLSNVTKTIMTLIQDNINQNLEPGLGVVTTPQPPEIVGSVPNRISVHLYHAKEDPSYKNVPGAGTDVPNVAKANLALILYYIITAHHDTQSENDALTQQRLMGYVMKTLHDFPVITDNTVIRDVVNNIDINVLHANLRDRKNKLQIVFRPVEVDDSIAFWSAEEQRTARLSAYYEVRVILIEPERPRTMPGIVLSVGAYPIQIGTPYLERSISHVNFTLPANAGGLFRSLEMTPARVAQLPPALPGDPQNNRLRLEGVNLTGLSQTLIFHNRLWAQQTPTITEVEVNEDPAWIQSMASNVIDVDIHGQILHSGVPLAVLPGTYTAKVSVVKNELVILNTLKQIRSVSNEISFMVVPRITGFAIVANRIQVNLENTFDLTDPQLDELIELAVDGRSYEQVNAFTGNPLQDQGKFIINSNLIIFEPLFNIAAPGVYSIRFIVNGAEAQPYWIEIP